MTLNPSKPEDQSLCKFCRRNFSKYTCPQCNSPYCSLSCYRTEAHSQCTEQFYRNEIEVEIKSAPSKSSEEKRKMMEVLKRFEEENAQDEEGLQSDEEDGGDDLAQRLNDMDINDASPEVLWSALSEQQRATFMKAIQDPESEQVKDLLASEPVIAGVLPPWWEEVEDSSTIFNVPAAVHIPESIRQAGSKSRSLIHNIFALSIAYSHVIRHFGVSSLSNINDPAEVEPATTSVLKMLPFLTDKKSTVLFTGVDSALTDVVSRMDKYPSPSLMRLILSDSLKIMRPARIVEPDTPASLKTILMLSDLHRFLSQIPKMDHVRHKLLFYAGYVATLDPSYWKLLLDLVEVKIREID